MTRSIVWYESSMEKISLHFLLLFIVVIFTNGCTPSSPTSSAPAAASAGQVLLTDKGCTACHSLNGQPGIGPTFKGLFGKRETFQDGSSAEVTEAYLKESIRTPNAKVVLPYQPVMPAMPVTDAELQSIVDFIRTLK